MVGKYVVEIEFPFDDDGAKAKEKADDLIRDLNFAFSGEDVRVTYERKGVWNNGKAE